MADCTIIFPFQLFDPHPALDRSRAVVFIEEGLIFGDPHVGLKCHKQKLAMHRASMKTYAATLEQRGFDVLYQEYAKRQTITDHLRALSRTGFDTFHYCEVVDFLLNKRLQQSARDSMLKLQVHETPMFLTPTELVEEEFSGNKRPFMARFYEKQRKRLGILIEKDGSPRGGKWSFDHENRKPMPKNGKGLAVPLAHSSSRTEFTDEAMHWVNLKFPDYHGDTEGFSYPTSHNAAERWFESFLEQRFHLFGDYEDSISRRERVLFHSVLTPMLNTGLLTPCKVLDRALEFAEENATPLNSVEGFVRQIIGWREFIRGAYDHLGVPCRNGNFWNFEDKPIPAAFYKGTTGIDPIDLAIRRALDHGWAHHIERLMLLGNFMLLCGFHPRRVYEWFMELFVDAYDWVMVPNVFGMSQFADGGLFTTKPYISGSNYVRKMSDFPKGSWCEVWDGLFWTFIKNHESFFRKQHRLGMMTRQLDKMAPEKLNIHQTNAQAFLAGLE
ncbi:MAG: cryptochrome/photolyase family protein [Verrucomicrobiales bacterium]